MTDVPRFHFGGALVVFILYKMLIVEPIKFGAHLGIRGSTSCADVSRFIPIGLNPLMQVKNNPLCGIGTRCAIYHMTCTVKGFGIKICIIFLYVLFV